MKLSTIILAAGQGKRMKSEVPKVLQPLAGRPLLRHVIDTARALEPAEIYVVFGHGGAQVQAAMSDAAVHWVLQAEQLGTGHAVQQAITLIPDDHRVLILYGDVPLIRVATLQKLIAQTGNDTLALLTVQMRDASGYGRIVRDGNGQISAIVEEKDTTRAQRQIREANTGLMAISSQHLRRYLTALRNDNAQREYYLTDVIAAAVGDGVTVQALEAGSEVEVQGVNDKVQLAEVEAGYRQQRARELMLAGATLTDPTRIDIRGAVAVGCDVFIDVNAVLIGEVRLGARVKIGPNCFIRNAVIGADTEVHPNSVIDNAIVGERCVIGPFARVRPESVLHDDVHVGNFVEIKKSEIGTGSKANHLSYIGDAQVGKGVNVGAGTITCNYDGQNKWPTLIDDGAFIGSGSMLVAPLRIGAGATIGAGSTITESAPPGTLSLERAKQVAVAEWKRPEKLDARQLSEKVDRATRKSKN